jgi:DNA-binding XRE family transcriptional regulator
LTHGVQPYFCSVAINLVAGTNGTEKQFPKRKSYSSNAWVNANRRMKEMAHHNWNDVRGKVATELGPKRLENARAVNQAYVDAYMLAEKRRELALSQEDVAERMGVTKGRVSQIECGRVSTLDAIGRYIQALGGQLRLTAEFDSGQVPLSPAIAK